MEKIYSRPKSLNRRATGFCPGCMHGVVTKMICEAIDEFDMQDKTTAVLGIGCGSLGMFHFDTDLILTQHGRAPATATGVKRNMPDQLVFTYQGDGDLAAIGLAEIMHCANRGENITVIFINNSTYGMTGGQMAPTTLIGQKSTTTQTGRNPGNMEGYPMHMCEILNQLEAPQYIARFSLSTPVGIMKAREGIKKAFKMQLDKKGFTFVELLSNCPTNWGMTPEKTLEFMKENTMKVFELGEFRVPKEDK